ncbi:hypothetical protein SAMN04488543_4325 [Friedmanniella luteola]|uniref:Uncharacterized protein n=1 Tax=Friedmanniella luteola TaxID=546871 RepID=A0A1H2A9Y2_9ACTN|nr:hypothetical protein [Friedmanniella luteola]SDT42674.1 hypothetical protein SAMN04488543_4325 [Friedmanniella luteola]
MTAVLDPAPAAVPRPAARRRAWLLTAAGALVTLLYLLSWSVYALAHTGDDRYRAVAPGAPARALSAEWRLLGLVRTPRLVASSGEPGLAGAGATYVVAELERTPVEVTDFAFCTTALLGPGGRVWEPGDRGSGVPSRDTPGCSSEDREVGRAYRFEVVYLVPTAFVDQVVGVALPDRTTAARTPVLRPPA